MASSDLAQDLRESAIRRRAIVLEEIAEKESSKLKPGQYAAYWQGYANNGDGLVMYNGTVYQTIVYGTSSIPRGTQVNLTVTSNKLFSNW